MAQLPDAIKVDVNGRSLSESSPPDPQSWSDIVVNDLTPIFDECLDGEYYVGFQLYYDLGDRNTTVNWKAHLEVALVNGVTTLWTKPLEIEMANQNFISTIFHDQPVSCSGNDYQYKVTVVTPTGTVPGSFIYLKPLLLRAQENDFDPSVKPIVEYSRPGGRKVILSWNYEGSPATEFDVEWVFISSHENFSGTAEAAFAYKASAGITTAAPYYSHTHEYPSGKVAYRVRAVGYRTDFPDHRILGDWSYTTFGADDQITYNWNSDITWQSQSVFTEDGKFKKVLTYYDPTLRPRQTITNLGSGLVVSETLYDFEGRPSVEMLPAPYNDAIPNDNVLFYNYKPDLNPLSSSWATVRNNTTIATPQKRKKFHYDNGPLPNGKGTIGNGAGHYYSYAFWGESALIDYIPDSKGYVYSQREYTRDASSKILKQSGVGEDFRMDGGRITQYYYGQAAPEELTRLFGSNVGNASHYKKNVTVDGNLQVSVNYTDQQGRTIATALAGDPPTSSRIEQLNSYPTSPTTFNVDVTDKNRKEATRSVATHKIMNEAWNTPYTFNYTLSALVDQAGGFNCLSCSYDLEITITDPDGVLISLSGAAGNEAEPGSKSYKRKDITATCATAANRNITFQLTFNKFGDHTITKVLTPKVPTYESVRSTVTGSSSVQTLISQLPSTYIIDETECETCVRAPDCPEAYAAIEEAEREIAEMDCHNIYNKMVQNYKDAHGQAEPPNDEALESDELWCKYEGCIKNVESDIFDKHLARIPNWSSAIASGYASPTGHSAPMNKDPFFQTVNGNALSGAGHQGEMDDNLDDITVGHFQGSIEELTDPESRDADLIDEDGYHILYTDIMSKRSTIPAIEYGKTLDEARWTMYRSFYLEAKRKTKQGLSEYQECGKAMEELGQADQIPDTKEGIADWDTTQGLAQPITDEELDIMVSMIVSKCEITLEEGEAQAMRDMLEDYFDSDPTNYLHVIRPEDVHNNQYLDLLEGHLEGCSMLYSLAKTMTSRCFVPPHGFSTSNKVTNPNFLYNESQCDMNWSIDPDCFPGWETAAGTPTVYDSNGFLLKTPDDCDSAASDAVRGTFTSALIPGKIYRFCFKYKAYKLGSQYTGTFDHASIRFSKFTDFADGLTIETFKSGGEQNLMVVDPCPSPWVKYPDKIQELGSTDETYSVWDGSGDINNTYLEECVTFLATEASQYFFVFINPNNAGAEGVIFKDFRLNQAIDSLVACGVKEVDDLYSYNVDWETVRDNCMERAGKERTDLIALATERLIEEQINNFYAEYKCLDAAEETLGYSYARKEYHYTLYYYDQAGNLVQTVPPKGVDTSGNAAHGYVTKYQYNSYNQVITRITPDADTSQFWYNNKGQLRMSRNAQQTVDSRYSYSKYDDKGRVTEAGELTSSLDPTGVPAVIEDPKFPKRSENTLSDITWTYYDTLDPGIQTEFVQENLRNRVSYTEVTDAAKLPGDTTNLKTYFSYDIHGNVKALRQQIPGLPTKEINYAYDLISNKVNYAFFQFGKSDEFAHRYQYDNDNRLTAVYTSTDRYMWYKDASYEYYAHGPLARVELGKYRVQGLDHYYTLQGWLKGVNMPYAGDPGGDGDGSSMVGKDAIAFTLGYFRDDYAPRTSAKVYVDTRDNIWGYTGGMSGPNGLYNGNISWMITDLAKQGDLLSDRRRGLHARIFKYDQLNRITDSRSLGWYTPGTGFASPAPNLPFPYDEKFTYDPNGNLLTLTRQNDVNVVKDNFTYQYYSGTNKLLSAHPVTKDLVVSSGALKADNALYRNITVNGTANLPSGSNVGLKAIQSITLGSAFTADDNTKFDAGLATDGGTYQYDKIGNLVFDQENGVNIKWTPQGKVREVHVQNAQSGSTTTTFRYDAMGNRVEKKVVTSADTIITRYLRDAVGNVMSVYNDTTAVEYPIYGSSRLGQYIGGAQEGKTILGLRHYELTNHLGNVLSVINDKVNMASGVVAATVLSTADYYVFGEEMAGRTWRDPSLSYRYGFNGKERDANAEWGSTQYDYGFRIYNPTIARFLSVDPLTNKYPWYTPYQFSGNTPVLYVDMDGKEPSMDWIKKFVGGARAQIDDNLNGIAYTITAAQRMVANQLAIRKLCPTGNCELTEEEKVAAYLVTHPDEVKKIAKEFVNSTVRNLGKFADNVAHGDPEALGRLTVELALLLAPYDEVGKMGRVESELASEMLDYWFVKNSKAFANRPQVVGDFISEHAYSKHKFDPSKVSTKNHTQYGEFIDVDYIRQETINNADEVVKQYDKKGVHFATIYKKKFDFNISTNDTPTMDSRVIINHQKPLKSSQFPLWQNKK